jgi:hypothetical protein
MKTSKPINHERELWAFLERLDATDLHIVLDDEGYAVWQEMPGPYPQ